MELNQVQDFSWTKFLAFRNSFFCMFKIENEDEKMNVNPTFGFRVRV